MKNSTVWIAFLLMSLIAASASADAISLVEGSVEAGKAKSITCAACHGADGNSQNPEWPTLAGQHSRYIYNQLKAYKEGARTNVLMTSQAMMLGDQDMRDLAVYFEAQAPKSQPVADPQLIGRGEKLYRGGDDESGTSACIACHGPTGNGNSAAAYPDISGQHATYTATQLRLYAAGERRSDMNQIMRNIARTLSQEDIAALASYVQGLY